MVHASWCFKVILCTVVLKCFVGTFTFYYGTSRILDFPSTRFKMTKGAVRTVYLHSKYHPIISDLGNPTRVFKVCEEFKDWIYQCKPTSLHSEFPQAKRGFKPRSPEYQSTFWFLVQHSTRHTGLIMILQTELPGHIQMLFRTRTSPSPQQMSLEKSFCKKKNQNISPTMLAQEF